MAIFSTREDANRYTFIWRCEWCLSKRKKSGGTIVGGYWEGRTDAARLLKTHTVTCSNTPKELRAKAKILLEPRKTSSASSVRMGRAKKVYIRKRAR